MSKVLIVTMHRGNNYGSALQIYALSEAIKSMDCDPVVLDYIPERIKLSKNVCLQLKAIIGGGKSIRSRYSALRGLIILLTYNRCFSRFFRKNLRMTRPFYSSEEIQRHLPVVDVYMTGSDQVWNSYHNHGIDSVFFLKFAPDDKPKVSYAASFGKGSLDEWEISDTKAYLQRYSRISVREQSAVEILHSLGINGEEVLDPTFLFNKEEWLSRSVDHRGKEKYVLIYSVEPDKQSAIDIARTIADRLGVKVYMVEWGRKPYPGVDKMVSLVDPLELIDYFAKAEFVVASSFHGTALSLNLNKPFISLAPKRFNSRVASILSHVGLTGRLVTPESLNVDKALIPIDYERVNKVIALRRTESKRFLKKALYGDHD